MAAPPPAPGDDVAAVDRALLRLSLTPEEALAPILQRVLPALLSMLQPGVAPSLLAKLLETLSHINKRVKDRPLQLPFAELLALLPGAAPFTANFVLVYLRMAFERLDTQQRCAAALAGPGRSEERRVGKECANSCRSRWSPYH